MNTVMRKTVYPMDIKSLHTIFIFVVFIALKPEMGTYVYIKHVTLVFKQRGSFCLTADLKPL